MGEAEEGRIDAASAARTRKGSHPKSQARSHQHRSRKIGESIFC